MLIAVVGLEDQKFTSITTRLPEALWFKCHGTEAEILVLQKLVKNLPLISIGLASLSLTNNNQNHLSISIVLLQYTLKYCKCAALNLIGKL